jgi:hypothetical protein
MQTQGEKALLIQVVLYFDISFVVYIYKVARFDLFERAKCALVSASLQSESIA